MLPWLGRRRSWLALGAGSGAGLEPAARLGLLCGLGALG